MIHVGVEAAKNIKGVMGRRNMKNQKYQLNSWIDPRVEVRKSLLGGKGLFAKALINEDETVIVWGGIPMTTDDIHAGKHRPHTAAEIGENLYLAAPAGSDESPDEFLNHSCDPNLWMKDEVTLIARRDIQADEELTADYAMWASDPEWVMHISCNCGSKLCRHRITGNDWQRKDLQERYKNHFSPYLNERIKKVAE